MVSQGGDSGGRDDGIRRRLGREAERGQTVHELRRTLGVRLGIVATGGVDTPAKALAVLEAGADAVGCFTAFITRGPAFPGRIGRALLDALDRRGLRRLADLRLRT
jgi:dihydroorotate dehydrogenase